MNGLAARNRVTGLIAAGVVVAMCGLSFAAVPLYRVFCQVTGLAGTPAVAEAPPGEIAERRITARTPGMARAAPVSTSSNSAWPKVPRRMAPTSAPVWKSALNIALPATLSGPSISGVRTPMRPTFTAPPPDARPR